jgi:hypothetical protein
MLCSPHSQLHSANPKNIPGPIRAAPRSRSHSGNLKNVHRPISFRSAGRSAASPKNVLGPILDPPLSSKHRVDPKNVPGPIRAASRSQSHSVNLKNVHRPIRYVVPFVGHGAANRKNVHGPILAPLLSSDTRRARKMFLDLSEVRSTRWAHAALPKKCSWTYLQFSLLLIAFSRPEYCPQNRYDVSEGCRFCAVLRADTASTAAAVTAGRLGTLHSTATDPTPFEAA